MYKHSLLLAALLACAAPLRADPGYYVQTAYGQPGALNLDLRYWTVKPNGGRAVLWPEIGIGYGVNSRWTTGLLASWIGLSDTAQRLSSLNWQNQLLLTQGEYPVDLALMFNLIRLQQTRIGHVVEWGGGVQTDVGRTQLNLNLLFDSNVDTARPLATSFKYQWQVRHRWQPGLHVGLQGFGELGRWDGGALPDAASHRIGPALFGRLGQGTASAIDWQVALLLGQTGGRSGNMFSLRLNYSR